MSTDLIRYDLLVQDAMRDVLRKVMADVAETGYLPGDHHFTISFNTHAPGVRISKRLAEQWPQEMTIILQHQFSNLMVDERGFGVGLSFRSIPEQLYIPFDAVTGFFDPSVDFGLKFETLDEKTDEETSRPSGPSLVQDDPAPKAQPEKPAPSPLKSAPSPIKAVKTEKPETEGNDQSDDAAKVVSIDAFRKKP
jgi:hypothetical protein